MTNTYLECCCHSSEHTLKIVLDENLESKNPEPYMNIEVQLIHQPWWKRIQYALRYVFGYQCRYGAWDEFLFNDENATVARDLLNRYLAARQR